MRHPLKWMIISLLVLPVYSIVVYAEPVTEKSDLFIFLNKNRTILSNLDTLHKIREYKNNEKQKSALLEDILRQTVMLQKTPYISEDNILNMLISALSKNNYKNVRMAASGLLTEKALQKDINAHFDDIYVALDMKTFFEMLKDKVNPVVRYNDFFMLIGRLSKLPSKEKKMIFNNSQIPSCVKAKLGDKEIEKTIIKSFIEQDDYYPKASLAKQLGYIASENAIKALLKQLSSSVENVDRYGKVSIRFNIIQALRQALPEEELFNQPLNKLSVGRFSASSTRDKERKEYAEKVNEWSYRKYGFKVWNPEKVWFKFSSDTPISY